MACMPGTAWVQVCCFSMLRARCMIWSQLAALFTLYDGYMQPCKRAHALSSLTTRRDWPAWWPGQTDIRSPYAPLRVPVLVNTPQ